MAPKRQTTSAGNEYLPTSVSAPGETLAEALEERDLTQAELARRLGIAPTMVNEIVRGEAPITSETAFALERVLGISAGFWTAREQQYREHLARRDEPERLSRLGST